VVVTAGTGIASTDLIVPTFIERHNGGLAGVIQREGALYWANPVLSLIEIGGFEHHLVIVQGKVAMKQRNTKSTHTIVVLEHKPNLFQTLRVPIANRLHFGDVLQCVPLN
jgi:hypothetical protein